MLVWPISLGFRAHRFWTSNLQSEQLFPTLTFVLIWFVLSVFNFQFCPQFFWVIKLRRKNLLFILKFLTWLNFFKLLFFLKMYFFDFLQKIYFSKKFFLSGYSCANFFHFFVILFFPSPQLILFGCIF